MVRTFFALSALALTLAACGESTLDRGLSGAGIGAASSAATGGSMTTGAVLGGAAGAAAGVLTNSDQIDLGKPIWKR